MNSKRIIFLLIGLLSMFSIGAQMDNTSRTLPKNPQQEHFPKIGLTLSGGGVRGLAHISVLRALDSVGLRIDAVTGTSIGAIIGSLYAAGFTGHEIDSIAALVQWDVILSDKVPLRKLSMSQKEVEKKYTIDLPFKDGKLGIERSLLEGQGIWDEFTELLFPVMGINDFSKLKIPYKCVAADIRDGHEVILESGSILNAVRASMAVPAAFSPVEIDGELLIDGGVTRNLPVQEVIDMGADFVIGIDLNHGGDGHLNFDDPTEVLLNIGFFNSNADLQKQIKLCDYFFGFDLRSYGAGDFEAAQEITQIGYDALDSLVTHFARIKRELETKYGPQPAPKQWNAYKNSYTIDSVSIKGLDNAQERQISDLLEINVGDTYTKSDLKAKVDRAFSTNRYKSLYYNFYPYENQNYTIEFVAVPKSKTYISSGLQYNEFERINVIGKAYMHDVLLPRSKTVIGAALGQNIRLYFDHIQSLNKRNTFGIKPYFYLENITLTNRDARFEINAQYRQKFYRIGAQLLTLHNPKWQLAAGWQFENVRIEPNIYKDFIVEGKNPLQSLNLIFDVITLNKKRMPNRGTILSTEARMIYRQNPDFSIYDDLNNPIPSDSIGLTYGQYFKWGLDFEHYFKLSPKLTLMLDAHSQNNISFTQNLVDNIQVGGIQKTFRNQETFIGLDAADITTTSFSSGGLDLQYSILTNLYLHMMMDVGTYDYLDTENTLDFAHNMLGLGVELQYNSLAGPLHFAMTYSSLTEKLGYTLYFGLLF